LEINSISESLNVPVFLVSGILFWVSILGLFGRKGSAVLALSLGLIWLTCAGFGMLFLDKKLLFINYLILGILVVVLFGFMAFNMWGVLIFMASIVWCILLVSFIRYI